MNTSFNISKCLLVCVLVICGCSNDKEVAFVVREKPMPVQESFEPEPKIPESAPVPQQEKQTVSEITLQPSEEATEIVRKSDDLMRGQSLKGLYTMEVVTPGWTRQIKMRVQDKDRTKTFIRILEPAKEEGIGTLRIDDEMWNYLPKVEQTIKIPPSMMGQPWMGSDFANDDLVNQTSIIDDYRHTIIAEKEVNESEVSVIRLDPKEGAAVPWGKLIFTIRKSDFIPLREEYYNERGELVKALDYSAIRQMSDREIPTVWTMISHIRDGHYTVIEVKEAEYNKEIPDNIFTLRNLKHVR